jgi:hypothetical protein
MIAESALTVEEQKIGGKKGASHLRKGLTTVRAKWEMHTSYRMLKGKL